MTLALGNVPAGSTIYIPFATYGKTNGESITMTGFATADIKVFKNGSATARGNFGYTLLDSDGTDFAGITGIHGFSVDLSNTGDGSVTFTEGASYFAVVSSVTVDGQTINFVAATWTIYTIPDQILDRNLATGTDSGSPSVRTVRQALRFLRNKWSVSGSTMTVTKEDDTTASWTATVTGTAGADPITAVDPA
jgi:hypothetical protein